MNIKKVGIISSIPQELEIFKSIIKENQWDDKEVVFDVGGIGKVSAAITAQKMISEHNPDLLIYVGGVGAIDENLKVGDIMIVTAAIDADMDARAFNPMLKLGQNPYTRKRLIKAHPELVKLGLNSKLDLPIKEGYCATISKFLDTKLKQNFVTNTVPELEVEIEGVMKQPNIIDMESAGVMMAAESSNTPCMVIRTIANATSGDSTEEYRSFIHKQIDHYLSIVAYVLHHVDN